MAYLAKGKKQDLIELAEMLDVEIGDNPKVLEIKDSIIKSPTYDEDFTKECLNRIINDRKDLELRAQTEIENKRLFDLEKLKFEAIASSNKDSTVVSSSADSEMPKLELHKLLPNFDPKTTDISLFLHLFEKQLTFLKVPSSKWIVYLIGLLPTDIANLIAKESLDESQDYEKVKHILLKRFKLSAEKFRQMFAKHQKNPESTWRDFYFELQNYLDGWIKEANITTFEELKHLIVADQIKKKTPPDYKEHYLDQWCNWNTPLELADKLDFYEDIRNIQSKSCNNNSNLKQKEVNSNLWRSNYPGTPEFSSKQSLSGFLSQSRRETGVPSNSRRNPFSNDRAHERRFDESEEDRNPIYCYGCGAPGIIRSKCHTCNPAQLEDDTLLTNINQVNFYSFSTENTPISIIKISICNTEAAVCADTGATHSVAGEKLYRLLKQRGLSFEEQEIDMTLADGRTQRTEILTTVTDICIQGKVISTELIVLKNAKGNRTLLGLDFLKAAGIVLDLQRKQWYFTEKPQRKYNFVKAPPNITALLAVNNEAHPCQVRENKGTRHSFQEKNKHNSLFKKYEKCFQAGGEPPPFLENRINTRDHLPVSVPPYKMFLRKKEILKQEIDTTSDNWRADKRNQFSRDEPSRNDNYSSRGGFSNRQLYRPRSNYDSRDHGHYNRHEKNGDKKYFSLRNNREFGRNQYIRSNNRNYGFPDRGNCLRSFDRRNEPKDRFKDSSRRDFPPRYNYDRWPPDRPSCDSAPKERRKLQLAPRTKPIEPFPPSSEALTKSSIFGQTEPVDAREKEIEESLPRAITIRAKSFASVSSSGRRRIQRGSL